MLSTSDIITIYQKYILHIMKLLYINQYFRISTWLNLELMSLLWKENDRRKPIFWSFIFQWIEKKNMIEEHLWLYQMSIETHARHHMREEIKKWLGSLCYIKRKSNSNSSFHLCDTACLLHICHQAFINRCKKKKKKP